MGVNSPPVPEPEFDLNSSFVPVNISEFLKEISMITDVSERAMKIDDYVIQLQGELNKVHAFKRELPLCVLLLNDAIERLKEEKMKFVEIKTGPLIEEEFMAFRGGKSDENGGVIKSIDCGEKKNWMSSVQLWSTTNVQFHNFGHDFLSNLKSKVREEDGSRSSGGCDQICDKLRSSGGAFVPFKRQSGQIVKEKLDNLMKEKNKSLPVNNLSLCVPMLDSIGKNIKGNIRGTSSSDSALPERKRRRCWSPDLHRRFVNALQQLGGPHVATPKQIREVMQVSDLTNDEVKSHLQKYRLHVRKLPAPKLDGPWLARDQYNNSMSNSSISQSGSPEGPLGSAKGVSTTGGESMEEEEEEKSEGHNWKGRRPYKLIEERL